MAHLCCLAGIDVDEYALFAGVLRDAGEPDPATFARLNVTELGRLKPELIVCDIDRSPVDALELVRQVRFVLPACVIAVYTSVLERSWAFDCNLAGVNCLLSKASSAADLSFGLKAAMQLGCFTDPHFKRV